MVINRKTIKSRVPKKRVAHSDKHPKVASDRYRLRFSFWLNMNNLGDEWIADQIERLKNTRDFTRVVRDGIMLISELMKGETTLLYHLFPDIKPPPPVPPEKIKEMEQEINKLRIEVDILQQVIVGLKLPTEIDNAVKMTGGNSVAMAGEGAPVRTPRSSVAKLTPTPAVMQEADTSSAFLDMF